MTANATQPPVIEDTTTDHERDVAAIEQMIADVETAFNTNDPDLLTAHFAQNASVVNAAGILMSGRDALLEANRKGLAGFLRDEHARYEVGDIVFLRPDIAIAHKNAWATKADGELIDVAPAMIALYVLVKEQGRWWIVARQNTLTPS
ncbi:SgcJ/EcaC family oxidoreductase [Saccharopolyspora shandongensis]|nr:SgcJ/EcaC family oxidoreductase [Saccharopolyspora shandongensis]